MNAITESLRARIEKRAGNRCEYCRLPQIFYLSRFQIDHIISIKHSGKTETSNLALSCLSCNVHKGSDIASIDPITGRITALFHPRRQKWEEHFVMDSLNGRIEGRTPEGRTTVRLLQFNTEERIEERLRLIELGKIL